MEVRSKLIHCADAGRSNPLRPLHHHSHRCTGKMSFPTRIRNFVWGEVPPSKQEAKLLLKIDWFILSYCCLVYFTNCTIQLFHLHKSTQLLQIWTAQTLITHMYPVWSKNYPWKERISTKSTPSSPVDTLLASVGQRLEFCHDELELF